MKTQNKHDYIHTISRLVFFGGIFLVLFLFVKKISTILTPFVISFIIAYIFSPAALRMQHKCRVSKNFSAGVIVIIIQILFILILTVATPVVYSQAISLIKVFPSVVDLLESRVLPLIPEVLSKFYVEATKNINIHGFVAESLNQNKQEVFSKAYNSGVIFINIISTVFLAPILSFYMLRDWQKIHKTTLNLIPVNFKYEFEVIIHEIRKKVSAYISGEFYAIFILSLLYGISLALTGLKFGFFIGVLTAILSIIPYIGFVICFIAAILIALAYNMAMYQVIIIIGVFIVVQAIESNYVVPKFVGGKVGLHPLWIIFGLLAGGSLLGFIGLLLAIPITTVLSVFIKHYIKKYKNSEYYEN